MSIEDVLRKHEESLMSQPTVHAVGIAEMGGKKVIRVFVSRKVREHNIPSSIEGYEIDIQEIGTVTAQGTGQE